MNTTYIVYGQRYNSYDPFIDSRTKEVIDNGTPTKIKLGSFNSKKLAEGLMSNILKNVKKRTWKIWIESE